MGAEVLSRIVSSTYLGHRYVGIGNEALLTMAVIRREGLEWTQTKFLLLK